jgi:hypothetical protein
MSPVFSLPIRLSAFQETPERMCQGSFVSCHAQSNQEALLTTKRVQENFMNSSGKTRPAAGKMIEGSDL